MHLQVLSEAELTTVLLAIALLLLFAFAFGKLFELFRAPKVVGEIVGGMILGQTCLQYFFPENMKMIFQAFPEEEKILNIFYQLGLIFLMFVSGLNTKIEMNKGNSRLLAILFTGSMLLPFLAGICIYSFFVTEFIGVAQNLNAFMLVFLVSLAVTSIPVISQIFFDLNLMSTNFANMVLTVATIKDLFLWVFLNLAVSMVSGAGKDIYSMISTVGITILLFVVASQIAKLRTMHLPVTSTSFCTLVFTFLFFVITFLTNFQINTMYSAFIVGYIVKFLAGHKDGYLLKMKNLADVSFSFFIPIYFALIGIQLNLLHDFSLGEFSIYFITAFGLQFMGCFLALQISELKKTVILNFAIVMNARGGPGIVLATVGYYYQIINADFFTVLILTTMISSSIAGYWLQYQKKTGESVFFDLIGKSSKKSGEV